MNPTKLSKVSINLPFGIGGVEWEPDSTERRAAWSLYVEIVTRIAIEPLHDKSGILREALNSLYSLFSTTRKVLRAAGPEVGVSRKSLGGIAITVLNKGLRPFLEKWHPRLQAWEARRGPQCCLWEHELEWPENHDFRTELKLLQAGLMQYADSLASIAGLDK